MALPFVVTLTLIIIYISIFIKKKFSFLHNAIVFMVIAIVTKNYMTILMMELKFLKFTEDPFLILYFIIDREIILPLLIVIYLNLNRQIKGWIGKSFVFLTNLAFLQVLDALQNYFGVIEFIRWNMIYSLLINVSYIIIGLGISKALFLLLKWKGQKYDSYI